MSELWDAIEDTLTGDGDAPVVVVLYAMTPGGQPDINESGVIGPFCCRDHAQQWVYMAKASAPDDEDIETMCRITGVFKPGPTFYEAAFGEQP